MKLRKLKKGSNTGTEENQVGKAAMKSCGTSPDSKGPTGMPQRAASDTTMFNRIPGVRSIKDSLS